MNDLVQIPPLLPPLQRSSPFDLAVLALVPLHLLLSLSAAAFLLHFHHLRPAVAPGPLRRRLRLNSLWPVRLLLLLFASLISVSELLRLPLRRPSLCSAYAFSSQSFAEPAFFATLLFLLRASTHSKPSPAVAFVAASASAVFAASPFLLVHAVFLFFIPWALRRLALPPDLLGSTHTTNADGRCVQPLYGTVILAVFATAYVPLFISACWNTVDLVINKKLRVRLYALAAVVVVSLSAQVSALAASLLWNPSSYASQGLGLVSFASMLVCTSAGEAILVVQPVADALAIAVEPEDPAVTDVDDSRGEDGELDEQV